VLRQPPATIAARQVGVAHHPDASTPAGFWPETLAVIELKAIERAVYPALM
jgi:hypothetical protein